MSQTMPPPAAIRRVPVGQTISEAYGTVLNRLGLVFKAAAFPFLLSIALVAVSFAVQETRFLASLLVVLGFIPYTIFGVSWHRLTLLGPQAGAPPVIPAWRPRHWRFLGYLVAVMLIGYSTSIPVVLMSALVALSQGQGAMSAAGAIVLITGIVALIVGIPYVMMRLSFVFPAVAVDENYGLGNSWRHTRGQGFRLLGVMLLISLPMLVLIWALGSILGLYTFAELGVPTGQDGAPSPGDMESYLAESAVPLVLVELVVAAINYVLMALLVSALSIAFRSCTGWVPALGGPTATPGPGDAAWDDD